MLVILLLLLGCIAFAVVREMSKAQPRPADLQGHIRARGWGVLLLPVAVMAAWLTGSEHVLAAAELAVAGALVAWAPRIAANSSRTRCSPWPATGSCLPRRIVTGA